MEIEDQTEGQAHDRKSKKKWDGTQKKRRKKKISAESLKRSALYYLSRRGASRLQLKQALERRVMRAENSPEEAPEWIEAALDYCESLGYLNDQKYAEQKARSMRNRGASARKIRAKFRQKGIGGELADNALDESKPAELEAAQRYLERRRFDGDPEHRKKQLSALARNGFSYDVAKDALDQAWTETCALSETLEMREAEETPRTPWDAE